MFMNSGQSSEERNPAKGFPDNADIGEEVEEELSTPFFDCLQSKEPCAS
jgi:hypothetical protein